MIRFGVRALSGHRAATWKIWSPGAPKNDVYLACRALNGELKASLHESGRWHVSYSKGFYKSGFEESSVKPPSRFTEIWPRPGDIAPGMILAFRVIVPWNSATIVPGEEPEDIVWVPPAPENHAVDFTILITSSNCNISDWPAKKGKNSKFVGSFPLSNGDAVWVIYTIFPFQLPAKMNFPMRFFKNKDSSDLDKPRLRAIIFGDEPDGSRVMYDLAVSAKYNDSK